MFFPYKNGFSTLEDILRDKYASKYIVEAKVLNAKDYGVPQSRPRAIIKLYKKGLLWGWPEVQKEITLQEAIGDLPSLEAGETSNIKYHNAKKHNAREIECMKHTAEGCSAMTNEVYYPKKADGTRIKGFHNTYKRMKWNAPAPARTMNNGNIGSHNNVHPGRRLLDGTYSDARVDHSSQFSRIHRNSSKNEINI
jgi:DNA (cytosine-5)-methyltransferase 1